MKVMNRFVSAVNTATDNSLYYTRNGVAAALNLAGTAAQCVSLAGFSAVGYMQCTGASTRQLDNAVTQLLVRNLEEKGAFLGIVDPKLAAVAASTALLGAGTLAKKVAERLKAKPIPDAHIANLRAFTEQVNAANGAVVKLNGSLATLGNNLPELGNRLKAFTNTQARDKGVLVQLAEVLDGLTERIKQISGAVAE